MFEEPVMGCYPHEGRGAIERRRIGEVLALSGRLQMRPDQMLTPIRKVV